MSPHPQIGAGRKAEEEKKADEDRNGLRARMAGNLAQRARWPSASCMSVAGSSGSCSRMCCSAASSWTPRVSPPLATKLAASSRASSTTLSLPMDEVASLVPSMLLTSEPPMASVVPMKLLAWAPPARPSTAKPRTSVRRFISGSFCRFREPGPGPGAISSVSVHDQCRLLNDLQQRLRVDTQREHQQGYQQQHDAPGILPPVPRRVMTAYARFDQEQRDHDPQIIVQADGTAENQGAQQPPQLRLDAGGDDEELADEAGSQGDAGQRSHHGGQYRSQIGATPEQAPILVQCIRVPSLEGCGHQGHHAEGAQGSEDVGHQIDADGFDGQPRTGNQGNDQITEVGDGGIAQQAFEVALHECQQVTEQDGGNGDTCQQVVQPAATGGRRYLIQAHQHGEHGDLGSGGQKGGDRRRGTLIHVRRPQV